DPGPPPGPSGPEGAGAEARPALAHVVRQAGLRHPRAVGERRRHQGRQRGTRMTEATRAFSTDPAQLSSVREFVRAEARDGSFSEAAEDIALAVTEACANSILHTDSPQMTVSIMARRDAITI